MNNSVTILGIGGYTFDAAACLIRDGEIIAAVEEERFSRIKHHYGMASGMAYNAINFCLQKGEISAEDVDFISFCEKPWLRYLKRIPYRLMTMFGHPIYSYRVLTHEIGFVQKYLRELELVKGKKTKIVFPGHHLCHAASSFFTSPFEESAILTMDQMGEWETTFLGVGLKNNIKKLKTISYPHSLGIYYATITKYLGFKPESDEYKVMGLSAYGKPSYLKEMRDILCLGKSGTFYLNLSYFSYHINRGFYKTPYWTSKLIRVLGPERKSNEKITQHHMDIAASAQRCLEEVVFHISDYIYKQTKLENLCIAGGVGMNGVANGRLLHRGPFKHIHVPPVSSDNGQALGGALAIYHDILGYPRKNSLKRTDWGTEYSDEEIENILKISKIPYEHCTHPEKRAARLIADGKIVGWFQGRMEYGARALGFRSILANPLMSDMKDIINKFVKRREEFRPFAPAVILEYAHEYFEISDPIPFMTTVVSVKKEKYSIIPAVTHVDGTARVQTVSKENNLVFWKLIDEFKNITKVPIILNTSYNVMGEPLVESPEQALRTFYSTGMDDLIIGSFLVSKMSS